MIGLCFGPDKSPVLLNNAVHGGQADPSPGKFGLGVQALKHAEKFARIPHVKPGAVVPYQDNHRLTWLLDGVNFDHRRASARGILKSIAQQILKDLAHQDRVAFERGQPANPPLHFPPLALRRKHRDHLRDEPI